MSREAQKRLDGNLAVFRPFPLPLDVCLDIFCRLSIPDILNLRQTCRTFFEITHLRSLWHLLLRTQIIQEGIPVPGLSGRPIDSLSGNELERCTCRAVRLRRNWTSPSPIATRQVNISPTSDSISVNRAVQFLPGRGRRWLLSITSCRNSMPRKDIIHCWDVEASPPNCVAVYRCVGLSSFAVNTEYPGPAILALQQERNNQFYIQLLGINFSARDPESAFVEVTRIPKASQDLRLFSGPNIISQEPSGRLILWNVRTPQAETELRATYTAPRSAIKCHAAVLFPECVLVIRGSSVELYSLPSRHPPGRATTTTTTTTTPLLLEPTAQCRWRWQIDRLRLTKQAPRPPGSGGGGDDDDYRPIHMLVRFADRFSMPSNTIHHYVLHPSASARRPARGGGGSRSLPYHIQPRIVGPPIAAPLRLFAMSDEAVGEYGSAVWIDSHTEDYFGHHHHYRNGNIGGGQRLAGGRLWMSGQGMGDGDGDGDGDEDGDEDGEGWGGAGLVAGMAPRMASAVYSVSEEGVWEHLALDEQEGRIALGTGTGVIALYEYS